MTNKVPIRGRPPGNKGKSETGKPKAGKIKSGKHKECQICHAERGPMIPGRFYSSSNPMHRDGRTPWCKECIVKYANTPAGWLDSHRLKDVLAQIDRPFYEDILRSSINEVKNMYSELTIEEVRKMGDQIVPKYFKNINTLKQLKEQTFQDSVERDHNLNEMSYRSREEIQEIKEKLEEEKALVEHQAMEAQRLEAELAIKKAQKEDEKLAIEREKLEQEKRELERNKQLFKLSEQAEISDETKDLFGIGYSNLEYKLMQEKYDELKFNYPLQTNLHKESLATYCRFKVREELATAQGDVDGSKKWGELARDAADKGKLTPKQMTAADLQSGVSSISELVKTLEQAVDVIKILPRFKYRPNDAPDFNIWCYVNYERRLNGMPEVDYSDVYAFYDEKKRQYLEQNGDPYGIFKDDTAEKNRETVKTFIKLPDDYYDEEAGDSDGER